jgi:hypothetical protein
MNRTLAPRTLIAVFLTLVVAGIQSTAQAGEVKECSNASLQGSFGFTATGTVFALPAPFSGPFAEIGRQTFDGNGNTTATATVSANGNIVKGVTVEGTYVVNADCTGSMTLYILPFGSTVDLDFVIDDDLTELRALVTGTGFVETRVYTKQVTRGRRSQ